MRKLICLIGLVCLLQANAAFAQPGFPARGVEVINALYAGVNPQDDAARRVAIKRVCEQLQFDLGEQWGNKKRAGLSDDFLSPDSIAWRSGPDQPVSVWDVQASSGAILVFEGKPADHPNLPTDEATFMDCQAVDHIGGGSEPPPPPTGDDLEARVLALEQWVAVAQEAMHVLADRIVALEQQLANIGQRVVSLEAEPLVVGCRVAVFGIPISCSLVTQ